MVRQARLGETFTAISSGMSHTCELREDGSARCWGDNSQGQSSPTRLDKIKNLHTDSLTRAFDVMSSQLTD